MGFSAVHKVRALACERLERAILGPYESRARGLARVPEADGAPAPDAPLASDVASAQVEVCVLAADAAVATAAVEAGATRVYGWSDDLTDLDGKPGELGGAWPSATVPVLDEVCREPDHPHLDPWVRAGLPVAVGNVSELALAAQVGALPELRGCIPVHNASALEALERAGAAGVWLSPELNLAEISSLAPRASVPVGLVVKGRPRVMTSEHCVLQTADACVHDCARCALRRRRLSLRDRDGKLLAVRTDLHGRSRLYDSVPFDLTPQVPELLVAGVTRFAVDATLLDAREAAGAVARVLRAVEAARAGRKPAAREQGHSSGHLFMGIG